MFKKLSGNLGVLMPVFWVGFSIGMFPASLIIKRFGGILVMSVAAIIGAVAIGVTQLAGTLEIAVAAQFVAGAMWGGILVGAFSAALAIGYTGAEGKVTGLLFSTLAIATFARMAVAAAGILNNATTAPLLHWAPTVCWVAAGIVLLTMLPTLRQAQEPQRPS